MSPTRLLSAAATAALPLAAAACVFSASVLMPESVDGQGGAGGSSTTTSDTGTTNAGTGSSDTSASSGSVAGTTSSSGSTICPVTHPGGGECEYLPGQECGCSSTEKCTILEESTGKSHCLKAGDLGTGQECISDAACQEGTWCDHFTGTCERACNVVGDCVIGAKCVSAQNDTTGAAIPGLLICTANCEPIKAPQCGTGTTCAFDSSTAVQGFDCFVSGGKTEGAVCVAAKDCNKGLVCTKGATSTCQRWCTPVGTTFPATSNNCTSTRPKCIGFATPFIRNSVEYGTCVP
jgi:hypothetical protein